MSHLLRDSKQQGADNSGRQCTEWHTIALSNNTYVDIVYNYNMTMKSNRIICLSQGVKTLKELSDLMPGLEYDTLLRNYELIQRSVSGEGGYTNVQR